VPASPFARVISTGDRIKRFVPEEAYLYQQVLLSTTTTGLNAHRHEPHKPFADPGPTFSPFDAVWQLLL
jgi:hypothetical protein